MCTISWGDFHSQANNVSQGTTVYLSRSPRFKYRCPINIALSLLKGALVDLVETACPRAARATEAIQSDDMKAYNCI